MSQRVVLGAHTRRPIAVVREHGSRVECIALAPWLVPQTLEHLAGYWLGDFAPHASPESAVTDSLR
jgi:hypothetical protein